VNKLRNRSSLSSTIGWHSLPQCQCSLRDPELSPPKFLPQEHKDSTKDQCPQPHPPTIFGGKGVTVPAPGRSRPLVTQGYGRLDLSCQRQLLCSCPRVRVGAMFFSEQAYYWS
jgi:hypothetical protein